MTDWPVDYPQKPVCPKILTPRSRVARIARCLLQKYIGGIKCMKNNIWWLFAAYKCFTLFSKIALESGCLILSCVLVCCGFTQNLQLYVIFWNRSTGYGNCYPYLPQALLFIILGGPSNAKYENSLKCCVTNICNRFCLLYNSICQYN